MAKQLAYLRPYHIEMINMRLSGSSYEDIGKAYNKATQTVRNYFYQDDLFRAKYQEMLEERNYKVQARFENKVDRVQEALLELIDSMDERTKLAAIKEWLDRSLGKAVNKSEIKMDADINNTHGIDEKLLEDPEAVEALKTLFRKQKGDDK
jgi:carbamoylphosphate synthase large subunit